MSLLYSRAPVIAQSAPEALTGLLAKGATTFLDTSRLLFAPGPLFILVAGLVPNLALPPSLRGGEVPFGSALMLLPLRCTNPSFSIRLTVAERK